MEVFLREKFERFDNDADGVIDLNEFGLFMRSLGLIPTDDEIKVKTYLIFNVQADITTKFAKQELFTTADKNGNGSIEFNEFISVLDHPTLKSSEEEIKQTMENSFR